MLTRLYRIAALIVLMTVLTTAASASGSDSPRWKVGNRLTVLIESESIKYRLSATVIEILPNGVMVLKAQKSGLDGKDLWVYTLSGNVEPKSVAADRSVGTENIADLTISKHFIDLSDFIGRL